MANLVSRPCAMSSSRKSSSATTKVGGISYLYRDDFTTTEAAPASSPRENSPGPGSLALTQAASQKFSVESGALTWTEGPISWTQLGFVTGASLDRKSGQIAWISLEYDDVSFWRFGWGADAANPNNSLYIRTNDKLYRNNLSSGPLMDLSASSVYKFAIVQRATGAFHIAKVDSGNWKLIYVDVDGTGNSIFYNWIFQGSGSVDSFRIPDITYTPTPIASDSFDRADSSDLGTTDGAGSPESGGSGLTWTATLRQPEIGGNRIANDQNPSVGDAAAYVETGESDVTITSKLCQVSTHSSARACCMFRMGSDSTDKWLAEIDANTDTFDLIETDSGSDTQRATASVTIDTNTEYECHVIAEGTSIKAWLDGENALSYTSSLHETNTKHGCYLGRHNGASPGDYMDDFVVWPITLPAADQSTLDGI